MKTLFKYHRLFLKYFLIISCISFDTSISFGLGSLPPSFNYFPSSKKTDIWTAVEEFGAVGDGSTDDKDAIQDAIDSGKNVSLTPGKTYLIEDALQIDENESLYIPASSMLMFNSVSEGTDVAIIISTHGSLAGRGTIYSTRCHSYTNAEWVPTDPKTAVKLTGSNCSVEIGKIMGFEFGIFAGDQSAVGYCNIKVGMFMQVMYCIVLYSNGNGWVNNNHFQWGGDILYFNDDILKSEAIGIYIDGESQPSHNTFMGSIKDRNVALKLSGGFNRFLGFTAQNCTYTVVINGGENMDTRDNTIFGEYGEGNDFYSGIYDSQGFGIAHAVQIYGPGGENLLNDLTVMGGFYYYSDSTLKRNIQNIDNAYEKVLALRGTKYQRKSEQMDQKNDSSYTYGFIAQELKKILPELVNEIGPDSINTINYLGIIPILVEAFKENDKKTIEMYNKLKELDSTLTKGIQLSTGYVAKVENKTKLVIENISDFEPGIDLFPNPNKGTIYLKSSSSIDNVKLYNSYGQLMLEKRNVFSNSCQIDFEDLPNGIYVVEIQINNQLIKRRVIKV